MESSSNQVQDITWIYLGLCNIFDETKSQESYISYQYTLGRLKTIH